MKKEFLKKLRALLDEYDVAICFSVSECSDTYGLSNEKLVFDHRISKDSFAEERWLEVNGWCCGATDIPTES